MRARAFRYLALSLSFPRITACWWWWCSPGKGAKEGSELPSGRTRHKRERAICPMEATGSTSGHARGGAIPCRLSRILHAIRSAHFPTALPPSHGPCIPPLSSAMDSLFSSCVGEEKRGWVGSKTSCEAGWQSAPSRLRVQTAVHSGRRRRAYTRDNGTGVNHRVT